MSLYERQWDNHVKNFYAQKQDKEFKWPGDEWGVEARWKKLFNEYFVTLDVASWGNCLEIGAGSGKYTEMVLEASPKAKIFDCDVSTQFIDVCKNRLGDYEDQGRLEFFHIEGKHSDELFRYIESQDLVRKLDAFFSIDAMVHVDLQYLSAYLVTAALTLKPGAPLLMTLANAASPEGFDYLMAGIQRLYHKQGIPTAKFEFVSPEIVSLTLERLGFEIIRMEGWENNRDIVVAASLRDVELAETHRRWLGRSD